MIEFLERVYDNQDFDYEFLEHIPDQPYIRDNIKSARYKRVDLKKDEKGQHIFGPNTDRIEGLPLYVLIADCKIDSISVEDGIRVGDLRLDNINISSTGIIPQISFIFKNVVIGELEHYDTNPYHFVGDASGSYSIVDCVDIPDPSEPLFFSKFIYFRTSILLCNRENYPEPLFRVENLRTGNLLLSDPAIFKSCTFKALQAAPDIMENVKFDSNCLFDYDEKHLRSIEKKEAAASILYVLKTNGFLFGQRDRLEMAIHYLRATSPILPIRLLRTLLFRITGKGYFQPVIPIVFCTLSLFLYWYVGLHPDVRQVFNNPTDNALSLLVQPKLFATKILFYGWQALPFSLPKFSIVILHFLTLYLLFAAVVSLKRYFGFSRKDIS